MAFNRRRQPQQRGSYWFAQSGSDVADCLRHTDVSPLGYSTSSHQEQIPNAQQVPTGQTSDLNYTDSRRNPHIQDADSFEHVRQEARERQEELHRRRMEELVQHNENALRIREEAETDRRRGPTERIVVTEGHKQQVEDRRRALHEADQEWRESVLRRSQERDLRAEQYRKNRLSASILVEGTQAQPVSVMSSPARGASGDIMSRSMIVTSSAARRKTDLTPVTPSPWARGLGVVGSKVLPSLSRPQTAAGSTTGTPKRAVSMSRLDILAQPRRRFTMDDLKSRSYSAWKLNDSPQPMMNGSNGVGMQSARSMSHLASTTPQARGARTLLYKTRGHQLASVSRSEQVSPTHHQLATPHNHLRSRSQMSSDLSQSSVASSVGSPHANMRPKPSANRKVRPLSIAGSIPSSELDKKEKMKISTGSATPLRKPQKPVPPHSTPEAQTNGRAKRSTSPRKKESTAAVKEETTLEESTNSTEIDLPLLMTQSFTAGCGPIENRPAETRKAKSREEAMAEIAEARKKAKEEMERQAEEERKRKEDEAAAKRNIIEKRRQLEEEARLKREKEEEEKRLAEAEAKKAEEERLRLEEEQKRIEEEKQKLEAIERQRKEEQERLERKKRVEEIMARTRKLRGGPKEENNDGQQGGDSAASSANVSPVRELNNVTNAVVNSNQQNGLTNGHSANKNADLSNQDSYQSKEVENNSSEKVVEKKNDEQLISIENSNNGPSSTDSGTGSADFNSNSTTQTAAQAAIVSNNNNGLLQTNTSLQPAQSEAPLIQDLLS